MADILTGEQSLNRFLTELASSAPTPGGGGAAALLASTGAALVGMVCQLTIGKKAYADVEEQMRECADQADALRLRCLEMCDADVRAFGQVIAAYKMPSGDEEQKRLKKEALQAALWQAAQTPMDCAEAAVAIMHLARAVAETGNRQVISDAGVAVWSALAALNSAALNVQINTGAMSDKEKAGELNKRLQTALNSVDGLAADTDRLVRERM